MPFMIHLVLLSDWCVVCLCHETHGENVSNMWRTRSECVTEHRFALASVHPHAYALFSLSAFFIQFRPARIRPSHYPFNSLAHKLCLLKRSAYSALSSKVMSWILDIRHGGGSTIFTTVCIILNYLTRNMFASFGLFGHLLSLFHFGRNRLRPIEMNLWPFRSACWKMRILLMLLLLPLCRKMWKVLFGFAN